MNKSVLLALALAFACLLPALFPSTALSAEPSIVEKVKPRFLQTETPQNSQFIVYQDWQDSKRARSLPVKIYLPQGVQFKAPYPVVVFSHGLGGSREAAVYLGDYWSQHGYLCVFVQHPGSDTGVWKPSIAVGREALLQKMKEAASARNLIDRAQDIKFVLDELERRNQSDTLLKAKMDLTKIALAGHSFGAGTTLAIAGQSFNAAAFSARDERIKSALYLCPPIMGAPGSKTKYSGIKIPGMLLTGTEDRSPINDTKPEDRRIPFDGIASPHQYLINFEGADHGTFGGRSFRAPKDSDEKFHKMIDIVTTKFLDATLKNDASAWSWLDGKGAVDYLGTAAIYEHK